LNKRPAIVIIAMVYFLLVILSFLMLMFATGYASGLSIIFFILIIPYAAGLFVLFRNPRPWHHTYCATAGNITGFAGIVMIILRISNGEPAMSLAGTLILSALVIFLFMSFDFNTKVRKYFGKS